MPRSRLRLLASEAELTPFAPGEEPIWTADVDAALQTAWPSRYRIPGGDDDSPGA